MPLHYTLADSGGWIAICTPTRLLLVGGAVDDATVASLWRDLSSAEGMQQALELLTRHGLAATPPFALVETGEHGRAIVRGDVTVTITGASGVESLSGAGVTTWTERPVGAISALAMAVGGATGTLDSTEGLARLVFMRCSQPVQERASSPNAIFPRITSLASRWPRTSCADGRSTSRLWFY